MMASLILEEIINDTMRNFGGQESLTSRLNNQASFQSGNLEKLYGFDGMLQVSEMGRKERLFWILLFSFMVLVAAGGNIVVIYVVSTNKEMKSVTNYFLVNLSLADTMVSTLNVIFNFISMLNSNWPFGSIYCKISNFIAILSISASVFTLTAISCDRYNAIIHPLRPRMSHKHAIGWILLIWTLSSALSLPNLIFSGVVEESLSNDSFATCTLIWPDGRYPLSSYDHMYNIIILVVTYLVPIITMAILYYKVGRELWGHEAIGENIEKQARAMMAKKKIVKMMIVVVIIFALCWLPYHGFFVVNYYLPTIFQDGPLYYQRCFLIMYWLAMSNSMYNPIIIYFMNSKFRYEFLRVLCFICCCKTYIKSIKNDKHHNRHGQCQNNFTSSGFSRQGSHNHALRRVASAVIAQRQQRQFAAARSASSNVTSNNEVVGASSHVTEKADQPLDQQVFATNPVVAAKHHPVALEAGAASSSLLSKAPLQPALSSDPNGPIEVIITHSVDFDGTGCQVDKATSGRESCFDNTNANNQNHTHHHHHDGDKSTRYKDREMEPFLKCNNIHEDEECREESGCYPSDDDLNLKSNKNLVGSSSLNGAQNYRGPALSKDVAAAAGARPGDAAVGGGEQDKVWI